MPSNRAFPDRANRPWPVWAEVVVSLAVVYHVAALLAGCLAAAPASPVEVQVFSAFRPYCDLIYQGVAYRYYSRLDTTIDPSQPKPWGTPIVVAELEFDSPDGTIRRETLRLPDADPRWPRLRHQRRIDLAFHLASDPRWAASYGRHLCKTRGCDRVTLSTQTHQIPDLVRLRGSAGPLTALLLDPDDGSTYGPRIKLGEFRCTDFSAK